MYYKIQSLTELRDYFETRIKHYVEYCEYEHMDPSKIDEYNRMLKAIRAVEEEVNIKLDSVFAEAYKNGADDSSKVCGAV